MIGRSCRRHLTRERGAMRKQVVAAVFVTVLIGVGSVYANMPWWPAVGVSQADILAVMKQLPVEVPIVYMENIKELIPDNRAIVVATGLYLVDELVVR